MKSSNARSVTQDGVPDGTRGPDDDFYCHKYEVWYRIEDCVYRGRNRTYSGCVNCFQGHLNMRSVARGTQAPVCLGHPPAREGAEAGAPACDRGSPGSLLRFASPRGNPD